jgi:hypothetical protein
MKKFLIILTLALAAYAAYAGILSFNSDSYSDYNNTVRPYVAGAP